MGNLPELAIPVRASVVGSPVLLSKERNCIPGLTPKRQTRLQVGMPATPLHTPVKCNFYVRNTSCVDMRLTWETRVLDAESRAVALDLSVNDGIEILGATSRDW